MYILMEHQKLQALTNDGQCSSIYQFMDQFMYLSKSHVHWPWFGKIVDVLKVLPVFHHR